MNNEIKINRQECEQIQIGKQNSQKLIVSQFQYKFQTIKTFAHELRHLQIQITAKEDSQILTYTTTLINYLSHSKALQNQNLYRNALIGLGNFLSIKFDFFKRQFLSQKFLKNLTHYFSILTQKQNQQNFNALIYPIFYLIVLFIYNTDKSTSTILYQKLFTKKFLKGLCSVEFKSGNRIQRYLPVMIAFITKGSANGQNMTILKQLILKNLHFSQLEKNHFQFIYCLRMIINRQSFSLGQIRKYRLIETILMFLKSQYSSQQHITMALQVLKHIVKRHQILGYKVCDKDFLNSLEKTYKICPSQTLCILQIICVCLPYEWKCMMFQRHIEKIKLYSNKKNIFDLSQLQSIKIILMVIEDMDYYNVLNLLSNYSIELMIQRAFNGDTKLQNDQQNILINLLTKIITFFDKFNSIMAQSFVSILQLNSKLNKKIQTLIKKYRKQQQYFGSTQLR